MAQIAELSCPLNIFRLRKTGLIAKYGCYLSGTIRWSHGSWESSIGIITSYSMDGVPENNYIQLSYSIINNQTRKKEMLNYKIHIVTTPCNYGGLRPWFQCPVIINGRPCGRRVAVLYLVGKYFVCRHCGRIIYAAQMGSGINKDTIVYESDVQELYEEIKRFYYKGKPTRKYKRYLRLKERLDNSWVKVAMKLGAKF